MVLIDKRKDIKTIWTDDDCPKNDLAYLLDNLMNILTDENWNRLLAHTWVMQCIETQHWFQDV